MLLTHVTVAHVTAACPLVPALADGLLSLHHAPATLGLPAVGRSLGVTASPCWALQKMTMQVDEVNFCPEVFT